MQMPDNADPIFCFFTINSQCELIATGVLLVLSIAIIADAFRKYRRIGIMNSRSVIFIYRMIFAWWITYISANIFGIILFAVYDKSPNALSTEQMSQSSKYSFVVNWINAFIIQWLLIYVPYHWAKRITELFCYLNGKGSELELAQKVPYKGYQSKIYAVLKYYIRIRVVFVILPITFLIIPTFAAHQIIFKLMVASLLLDCIVIVTSLVFGMISLKTTEQLKLQLDQIQSKRMVNQYLMMTIASILRFGFDLFFVYLNVIGDKSFEKTCPSTSNNNQISEIIFNISQCIFTHYLPILIVLRIYNLEQRPEQITRSLLITAQNNTFIGVSS